MTIDTKASRKVVVILHNLVNGDYAVTLDGTPLATMPVQDNAGVIIVPDWVGEQRLAATRL